MSQIAPGVLLVATADLTDPNFADTVVLILDVTDGALGVVINRPSAVAVGDVLAAWADASSEPEVLFRGGPVSTDAALAVGLLADGVAAPPGFRAVLGGLGLVDLDAAVEPMQAALADLRVFAGYAGWGPGQLDGEIDEGAWYVVAAVAADVFTDDAGTLRQRVLRRQPGELAWQSTRPADADLN